MKIRHIISIIAPICLLAVGVFNGALPGKQDSYSFFSSDRDGLSTDLPGFQLIERKGIFQGLVHQDLNSFPTFMTRSPGQAIICDYDRDGFDDVLTIYNKPDKFGYLELFQNQKGKAFVPVTEKVGLKEVRDLKSFTAVACADFDNDGWVDLALAGIGQELVLFKNQKGHFVFNGTIDTFDEIRGLNVFDANEDGFLDIYTIVYRSMDRENIGSVKNYINSNWGINSFINNIGGRDKIYLNQKNGRDFKMISDENFTESGSSWAAGIGDFNNDGHADIFIAEDFGADAVFIGDGNGKFVDSTDKSLGPHRSRNSMSAEVVDVNGDGLPDVYVTNRPKPGMKRGYNSLWINQSDKPGDFKDEAIERGVDACGWSWGAQFSDINQDGFLDLMVVNGMFGKSDSSFWYVANYLPSLARPFWYKIHNPFLPPLVTISSDHRKCLFLGNKDGKFRDIAPLVGFDSRHIARGVVPFDFDQDGDEDILMVTPDEGPVLYENRLDKPGKWLSFRLKGTKSNATAIGATIKVKTSKRTLIKSNYPMNGFQSGRSSETYFTFQNDEEPLEVTVEWPKPGTRITVQPLNKSNQKITLTEPYEKF